MPTHDGQTCQYKMVGCSASIYDQPFRAQPPYDEMTVDANGWYVCDNCQAGFFWRESDEDEQGDCVLCEEEISGCFRCENSDHCQQCLEGFYPSLDRTSCIPPIQHCTTDPSNYRTTPGAPRCISCQRGFYPVEDRCDPCSDIDENCLTCKENGICTSCDEELFVAAKGTSCVERIDKCLSDPINYAVDHDGDFYCPKCDDGYTWAHK